MGVRRGCNTSGSHAHPLWSAMAGFGRQVRIILGIQWVSPGRARALGVRGLRQYRFPPCSANSTSSVSVSSMGGPSPLHNPIIPCPCPQLDLELVTGPIAAVRPAIITCDSAIEYYFGSGAASTHEGTWRIGMACSSVAAVSGSIPNLLFFYVVTITADKGNNPPHLP